MMKDFAKVTDLDNSADIKKIISGQILNQKSGHINIDPDKTKNGLGQLVLTVIKLIHELLEKQALRKIDAGVLTENEIEQIGLALMGQADEIEKLREYFHLDEEDLNLDLGPLGKLL